MSDPTAALPPHDLATLARLVAARRARIVGAEGGGAGSAAPPDDVGVAEAATALIDALGETLGEEHVTAGGPTATGTPNATPNGDGGEPSPGTPGDAGADAGGAPSPGTQGEAGADAGADAGGAPSPGTQGEAGADAGADAGGAPSAAAGQSRGAAELVLLLGSTPPEDNLGDALWVAPDPAALEGLAAGHGATVLRVPRGPAPEAPACALAMDGRPSPAVQEELRALGERSRKGKVAQPMAEEAGTLLYLLARARGAQRLLELGTGSGAAALWLGAAVERTGGRLVTIERDSAQHTAARKRVARAQVASGVTLRMGETARQLPRLHARYFDLVLVDHDPYDRLEDLGLLLDLLAPGALLLSHAPQADPSAHTAYAAILATHPRVALTTTLSVGEGLHAALLRGGGGGHG